MIDRVFNVFGLKTDGWKFRGVVLLLLFVASCKVLLSQGESPVVVSYDSIGMGAEQFNHYLPLLTNKRVAVLVNQASRVGNTHLVDVLLSKKINLIKILSPEHGFRGGKDAGEKFEEGKDLTSGLPIISLYGKKKKPSAADLKDVDVLLVDLQDVGARFYTYISTMSLAMEASAENGVKVIVLDRPNPNGFYVDGPVLEKEYSSFVGMHAVPVVYGMTIGEYALMVNGENWLGDRNKCNLTVVKMAGYRHNMMVTLKVAPSPNLPNRESVYLYPSLCFFEGTSVSVGRGTDFPFQVYGYPDSSFGRFTFTPRSIPGKSKYPKWQDKRCYGQSLMGYADNYRNNVAGLNLEWLISAYQALGDSIAFFNGYFDKLAGTAELRKQIVEGKTQQEIRESWQPALKEFIKVREKYLLYE